MVEADLVISSRLKALLPAMTKEEHDQLEANIVADGRVIDPLLFWHDGKKNLIVDGMNRYEIARKKGIPFRTEPITFASIEEAEVWILDHALGKRNLMKPQDVRKVRGELYNRLKRADGGHGDQKHSPPRKLTSEGQNVPPIRNAAEHVAERAGVDAKTVKRDGRRLDVIATLTPLVRKAVEENRLEVTDKELNALAKSDPTRQQEVAREVRTGSAKSVSDAMGLKVNGKPRDLENCTHSWVSDGNGERYCEHCKLDHPSNKKNGKPKSGKEKTSAAKLVDDLTRKHVGNLVRGLDAVAVANGGKGPVYKKADEAINEFIGCLKKMRSGER